MIHKELLEPGLTESTVSCWEKPTGAIPYMHTAKIVISKWTNVIQYVKKGLVETEELPLTQQRTPAELYIIHQYPLRGERD